ncbi:uncharacterized protein LOC134070784 [Sardina pilchardus]|uniref:uncharacterized protein LOC134070784 n=1 Tax=Sardina pilchardus TaxID=27697 RepID=UPI002E0F866D
MHFLWFLSLLFSSGVSENLTKIAVEFGQNVTLYCSHTEEIYWFIQRQSEPPVNIIRSFGKTSTSVYNQQHKEFREKYSQQTFGTLVIRNVTRTELGSYYCAIRENHIKFSNGTMLMITEERHSPDNFTRIDPQQPQQCPQDSLKSWMCFTVVVSCLLNCIFIALLSVLAVKRCSTQKKKSTSVEPPQDSDSLHYSAIVLPSRPRASQPRNIISNSASQPSNINSTYSELQIQPPVRLAPGKN